jgi:hypothetical protein
MTLIRSPFFIKFYGIVIQDSQQTSSIDKISVGNVCVAAASFGIRTVATLVNDKITRAATPTQELSCCGFDAEIVTLTPNSFQTSQFKSSQTSDVDPDFLMKKFGLEEEVSSQLNSAINPF